MPTLNLQVNASNRDGQQLASGLFGNITGGLLEVGNNSNSVVVAVSFVNVSVPQGATINNAVLNLTGGETWSASGTIQATIYGHAADNSGILTTANGNISSRTNTTANVATGSLANVVLNQEYSFNVTTIVQEIADRPGWDSGAMTFLIRDNGSSEWQNFHAWDGDASRAAKLQIEYSTGSTSHDLTATPLASGTPSVDSPALAQGHAVIAANLIAPAPTLGEPSLGQAHALKAAALSGELPILDSPAVGQVHLLEVSDDLSADSPTAGTPSLGQLHTIRAADLAAASPDLAVPHLGQIHALVSGELIAGSPVLGKPILNAGHNFTAAGLLAHSPVLDSPTLGQAHNLQAGFTAYPPALGNPVIGQYHLLNAAALLTAPPTLGAPSLDMPISPTPGSRTMVVGAEQRVLIVGGETRNLNVGSENRVMSVV